MDQGEDLEIVRREVVQVDLRPVEVPGEGIGDVHDEDGDAVASLDLATEEGEDFVEAGGGGGHGRRDCTSSRSLIRRTETCRRPELLSHSGEFSDRSHSTVPSRDEGCVHGVSLSVAVLQGLSIVDTSHREPPNA